MELNRSKLNCRILSEPFARFVYDGPRSKPEAGASGPDTKTAEAGTAKPESVNATAAAEYAEMLKSMGLPQFALETATKSIKETNRQSKAQESNPNAMDSVDSVTGRIAAMDELGTNLEEAIGIIDGDHAEALRAKFRAELNLPQFGSLKKLNIAGNNDYSKEPGAEGNRPIEFNNPARFKEFVQRLVPAISAVLKEEGKQWKDVAGDNYVLKDAFSAQLRSDNIVADSDSGFDARPEAAEARAHASEFKDFVDAVYKKGGTLLSRAGIDSDAIVNSLAKYPNFARYAGGSGEITVDDLAKDLLNYSSAQPFDEMLKDVIRGAYALNEPTTISTLHFQSSKLNNLVWKVGYEITHPPRAKGDGYASN